MLLTIVADDLTGACDTGALFTGLGRVGVFVAPTGPVGDWETVALDTETRSASTEAARTRVQHALGQAAPRLRRGRLFKKIDSTLRGHVGAELDALMNAGSVESALVCPAFPEQGRRVGGGVLTVDNRPVHETAIGRDPGYPRATSTVSRAARRRHRTADGASVARRGPGLPARADPGPRTRAGGLHRARRRDPRATSTRWRGPRFRTADCSWPARPGWPGPCPPPSARLRGAPAFRMAGHG